MRVCIASVQRCCCAGLGPSRLGCCDSMHCRGFPLHLNCPKEGSCLVILSLWPKDLIWCCLWSLHPLQKELETVFLLLRLTWYTVPWPLTGRAAAVVLKGTRGAVCRHCALVSLPCALGYFASRFGQDESGSVIPPACCPPHSEGSKICEWFHRELAPRRGN